MPYQLITGARIFYSVHGSRATDTGPILLVHGSTMTAESEWNGVIPALAEKHFVIAPDCRGHGQSSNPHHTYSFSEMAADLAMLVRALARSESYRGPGRDCSNIAVHSRKRWATRADAS